MDSIHILLFIGLNIQTKTSKVHFYGINNQIFQIQIRFFFLIIITEHTQVTPGLPMLQSYFYYHNIYTIVI